MGIDGVAVAAVPSHDRARRSLRASADRLPLALDELFQLSDTHPASFDSRYFGASAAVCVARPPWFWIGKVP